MKFAFLFLPLLISLNTLAGPRVIGNGGGIWACNNAQGEMQYGILVDLYEAEVEFDLPVIRGNRGDTIEGVFQLRRKWLKQNWPELEEKLSPYLERVLVGKTLVNANLRKIEDVFNRIEPGYDYCSQGPVTYQQLANFTFDGRIIVSQSLWNSSRIAAVNKAALLFHEAIYLMLRETKGDTDSVNTRYITGVLFTTLQATEMKNKIEKILD